MLSKTILLDVGITTETEENILKYVVQAIKNKQKITIVTPNPEILVHANRHKLYKNILNHAQVSLPDGVGVLLASKLLGIPIKRRITGVDFIEKVCLYTREQPVSMGFLGGGPEIAERASECLKKKYPWIDIVFAGPEWEKDGFKVNGAQAQERTSAGVLKENSAFTSVHSPALSQKETIGILFVAYGFPKQEQWIADNIDKLPITVAMGVGGSLDYLSGEVMRAPSAIRALGLEWLFRLVSQPWRWRRQLALVEFMWLVVKEKFLQRRITQN